jgi:hypothetical protein
MSAETPRLRIGHLMTMIGIVAVSFAGLPPWLAIGLTVIQGLLLVLYLAGSLRLVEWIVAMAIVFALFLHRA